MKRLFTNINTYEFNSQEDFYKSIVEELKSCEWAKEEGNRFLCKSVPFLTFYKMTAIDYRYFEEKNINFRYEIIYSKGVDNQYSWEVNFYENEERQYNDYLLVENDDLGLFPQEKTEEKSTKDKLIECINNYCNENTRSAFIDFLGDEFPGLWEDIVDVVRENEDTEETAKRWIDDNNGDAIDYVFDNCDSYDLKGYVIDFIRDNL